MLFKVDPGGGVQVTCRGKHKCKVNGNMMAQGAAVLCWPLAASAGRAAARTALLVGYGIHMLVKARLNKAMGTSANVLLRV